MYSWTERECRQLWDDILRAGRNEDVAAHFVGSIVYIQQSQYQISSMSPLLVIDGQQRLTTVMLLLEALARRLGDQEPDEGFSAKKIRNYYLLNPLEEGDLRFKLHLTQTDRESLTALVQQKTLPREASLRIKENFKFFETEVKSLGDDLTQVWRGVTKLMIVDISLSRDLDNPQLIFESMNSTGRELSQADLIRNFILMGLEPDRQTRLYKDYWRPMEIAFGQEAYDKYFDGFMRHYLTLKTGEIPNIRAVYEAFKAYSRSKSVAEAGIDALIADVYQFAIIYCAMALNQEEDKELAEAFRDLGDLKVDVAYPFLLALYDDYRHGALSKEDFLSIVRLVESYVFRRAVCSIPTNSLNKTFPMMVRAIDRDRYLESVQAHLLLAPSYRRFPNDDEFEEDLLVRDLYSFPRRSYTLRRLENYGRKERVSVEEYTIEHIMPQNENLSKAWQEMLGRNWKEVQSTWLHTIGNLTLTGYNAEYSDKPFPEKQAMRGGFRESPLHLSQGLGALKRWDEAAIRARAGRLSKLASEVWARPQLSESQLRRYKPEPRVRTGYSMADHPSLESGSPAGELFVLFRKDVMALDPGISEEITKKYIAFKAETNFVDVIPMKDILKLMLNMPFHEIHDPKRWARDMSNISHWGNGEVEVRVSSAQDIPYAIGLVRQSLERQLGNGDDGE